MAPSYLKRMCHAHPGMTTGGIFLAICSAIILTGGAVLYGFVTQSYWEQRNCYVTNTTVEGVECVTGQCYRAVWMVDASDLHSGRSVWNGTIFITDYRSYSLAQEALTAHVIGSKAVCYQQEGPNKWVAPQFKWQVPPVDKKVGLAEGCMIAGGSALGVSLLLLVISALTTPKANTDYTPVS